MGTRLESLLYRILRSRSEIMMPVEVWRTFTKRMRQSLKKDGPDDVVELIKSLESRHASFVIKPAVLSVPLSSRRKLTALLDDTLINGIPEGLLDQCRALYSDTWETLNDVLDWCMSPHKTSMAKLHVADFVLVENYQPRNRQEEFDASAFTTDIAEWAHRRDVANSALVANQPGLATDNLESSRIFFQLVSRFVNRELFDMCHYLHWLTFRDLKLTAATLHTSGPWAISILAELPTCLMFGTAPETRDMKLRQAGFNLDQECIDTSTALAMVEKAINLSVSEGVGTRVSTSPVVDSAIFQDKITLNELCLRLAFSSCTLKTRVTQYMTRHVSTWLHVQSSSPPQSFPQESFCAIGAILEANMEIEVMAGVIERLCLEADVMLLRSMLYAMIRNWQVLFILHKLRALISLLYTRYTRIVIEFGILHETDLSEWRMEQWRVILIMLADLAIKAKMPEEFANRLKQSVNAFDYQLARIKGSSQLYKANGKPQSTTDDGDLFDDLCKGPVRHSSLPNVEPVGPVHDKFVRVTDDFKIVWVKDDETISNWVQQYADPHNRSSHVFDIAMTRWAHRMQASTGRRPLTRVVPLLLAMQLLRVPTLIESAFTVIPEDETGDNLVNPLPEATYYQELLQFLVNRIDSDTSTIQASLIDRVYMAPDRACEIHDREMFYMIRHAIIEYDSLVATRDRLPLDEWPYRQRLMSVLLRLVPDNVGLAMRALGGPQLTLGTRKLMSRIAGQLLLPRNSRGPLVSRRRMQEPWILTNELLSRVDNEWTRPFCQLKLSIDLELLLASCATKKRAQKRRLDVMLNEIVDLVHKAAVDNSGEQPIMGLLTPLGVNAARLVRFRLRARILDLIPVSRKNGSKRKSKDAKKSQGSSMERDVPQNVPESGPVAGDHNNQNFAYIDGLYETDFGLPKKDKGPALDTTAIDASVTAFYNQSAFTLGSGGGFRSLQSISQVVEPSMVSGNSPALASETTFGANVPFSGQDSVQLGDDIVMLGHNTVASSSHVESNDWSNAESMQPGEHQTPLDWNNFPYEEYVVIGDGRIDGELGMPMALSAWQQNTSLTPALSTVPFVVENPVSGSSVSTAIDVDQPNVVRNDEERPKIDSKMAYPQGLPFEATLDKEGPVKSEDHAVVDRLYCLMSSVGSTHRASLAPLTSSFNVAGSTPTSSQAPSMQSPEMPEIMVESAKEVEKMAQKVAELVDLLSLSGITDQSREAQRSVIMKYWLPFVLGMLGSHAKAHEMSQAVAVQAEKNRQVNTSAQPLKPVLSLPLPQMPNRNGSGGVVQTRSFLPGNNSRAPALVPRKIEPSPPMKIQPRRAPKPPPSPKPTCLEQAHIRAIGVLHTAMMRLEVLAMSRVGFDEAKTVQQIFDVSCLITSTMSPSVRRACRKYILKHGPATMSAGPVPRSTMPSDSRLAFLLGRSSLLSLPNESLALRWRQQVAQKRRKNKGRRVKTFAHTRRQALRTWQKASHHVASLYRPRQWELLRDHNPTIGVNDAAVNIMLLDAVMDP